MPKTTSSTSTTRSITSLSTISEADYYSDAGRRQSGTRSTSSNTNQESTQKLKHRNLENLHRYRDGPRWEDPYCLVERETNGKRVARMRDEFRKVEEVLGLGDEK
ncbi:hypothetical protein M747DRAFT_327439 [Aspergillus niger ATCC 13496]|uniref:Contig An14c0100, genomic contig n=3 Tax=Aspergillus niger TaxID=5061 RepID=A2R2Z9_ASPNC|nr:uncharacterized protein An14g02530 [Aspergillus niger]RDH25870.1 hypothetical protein M747DRAFT_327439 [Aspergillus niger ATCC 13496]CAK41990.1 unnamed protein product [Aspergillus niger]